MNKVAVVLGVAAVATLAGCKDPEYARFDPDANQAKSVATEPAPAPVEPVPVESAPVEVAPVEVAPVEPTVTEVKTETPKCNCPPGCTKPCCGLPDCKCPEKPVAAPAPAATVYIIQRGDTLSKISKKFNIKIDAIKKLNNLKGDNVYLGQKLKLPGKVEVGEQTVPEGAIAKPAKKVYAPYVGGTKDYVVRPGDSLGKIAYSNGMNIRQLKELNGLASDSIRIGQKLKIADGSAKAAAPAVAAKTAEKKTAEKKAPAPVVAKAAEPVAKPEVKAEVKPEVKTEPAVEPAAPAPVVAPAGDTTTYVVKDGDDLASISIDFAVPLARIRELNNLGEGDSVKPGQVLKIPAEQ